ncbi:hypothetical protein [Clostridium sp. BSD9I1]|uniref:hypothetical protein n=1 Tax=Clostridium sp. BSD9I1 TaxID=2003589 RepID=UPI001644261C|nr:hypothetical protein [Clostridium sp. BSD9I1]
MEFKDFLDWAFARHLNPLSWYIRPIFLVIFALFAYRRSWKGILITILLMTSSMVWFPEPKVINPQMYEVLEMEKRLLSSPVSALLALGAMVGFMTLVGISLWKHSLKMGLIILNTTLLGKVVFTLIFSGENGWAPLGNTVFGLVIVNGLALTIIRKTRNKKYFKK